MLLTVLPRGGVSWLAPVDITSCFSLGFIQGCGFPNCQGDTSPCPGTPEHLLFMAFQSEGVRLSLHKGEYGWSLVPLDSGVLRPMLPVLTGWLSLCLGLLQPQPPLCVFPAPAFLLRAYVGNNPCVHYVTPPPLPLCFH